MKRMSVSGQVSIINKMNRVRGENEAVNECEAMNVKVDNYKIGTIDARRKAEH